MTLRVNQITIVNDRSVRFLWLNSAQFSQNGIFEEIAKLSQKDGGSRYAEKNQNAIGLMIRQNALEMKSGQVPIHKGMSLQFLQVSIGQV